MSKAAAFEVVDAFLDLVNQRSHQGRWREEYSRAMMSQQWIWIRVEIDS